MGAWLLHTSLGGLRHRPAGTPYLTSVVSTTSGDLESLSRTYGLLHSSSPNVALRCLPAGVDLGTGARVPPLITAVDLCDEGDPRSVRAGERMLARAIGSCEASEK